MNGVFTFISKFVYELILCELFFNAKKNVLNSSTPIKSIAI